MKQGICAKDECDECALEVEDNFLRQKRLHLAVRVHPCDGDLGQVNCQLVAVEGEAVLGGNCSQPGLLLRIWLKQGKEKRLLARILKFLEKARKRLSRQNATIKVRICEEKRPELYRNQI